MENIVYLNGSLLPFVEAKISVSDHGFLYGYGLFQTMRAYHGKLFLLDRHLKRLYEAAEVIGMRPKLDGIDLEQACIETLAANKHKEARVRLTVTNGEGLAIPWTDRGGAPNVVVTVVPYTPLPRETYTHGFRVGIASVRRMKQSVVSSMKSINYLLNVIARMEATAKGLDETILLNDDGYIAEGGGSNIFFVRESKLVTPSLDSGIIPGVTREVVIELAAALGIAATEGTVGLGVINKADEAFMTNAIIEVMPVVSVQDESGSVITIGGGKPGKVTQRLMAAYREKVESETLSPESPHSV
jgi:branched-chain amino acid aminotransferase group I